MKIVSHVLLGSATALFFPVAALAAPTMLTATLDGASETAGGDADGSGAFSAEIDPAAGDLCYTLTIEHIDDFTAAHIHKGAAGKDGPPVIGLDLTDADDDVCVAAEPDTLKEIVAAPAGYYVNVHSQAYPKGAVRGQLSVKTAE